MSAQQESEVISMETYRRLAEAHAKTDGAIEEIYYERYEPWKLFNGTKASTMRDPRTHVRRWSEFWAKIQPDREVPKLRCIGPKVSEIRSWHLELWQAWLGKTLRGSNVAHNVNKHLGTLRAVLRWCERRDWIMKVPWVEKLEADTEAPKVYLSEAEYLAFDRACEVATWPGDRQPPAAVQWRVALRWYVLYGFRTQELIAFEADHRPLLWSDLYPAGVSPAEGAQVEWAHGWLKYVPQKQEGKKPDPLVLPLHPEAVAWVDRLRLPLLGGVSCDRPLFAWPRSSAQFYKTWSAIAARAAEILGKPAVAEYGVKHLRKTCATWHETLTPGIAEHITGHGDRSVIQRHYVNHERMLVDHFSKFVFPQHGGCTDAGFDTEGRGDGASRGHDPSAGFASEQDSGAAGDCGSAIS